MKYEKITRQGIEEAVTFAFDNPDTQYKSSKNSDAKTINMRMDWSFSPEAEQDIQPNIKDFMLDQSVHDFADIIENGATSRTDDALYSVMDGAKVLGKEPLEVVVTQSYLVIERQKSIVHYNLFVRFGVIWSD